jgi:4-diphosphocytidyl-2C-methyl-D-erythritol kinase
LICILNRISDLTISPDASNSTKQIYEATGVQTCKVTHHRTAALQYAGFMGLQPHQINSLTNHILDKQHAAYSSQAEWEVSFFFYNYLYATNPNSHTLAC